MIDIDEDRVVKILIPAVSILSYDHPLSNDELEELINLLFAKNYISQIYFKGDIDFLSIERVKYLLKSSPFVDDSKVTKYILKNLTSSEKEQLLSTYYKYPDTWNIAYSIDDNRYSISTISSFRQMNEYFQQITSYINSDDMSNLDRALYIYDKVKILEPDNKSENNRLPEIICSKKTNSYGYNLLLKELFLLAGFKSCIFNIGTGNNEKWLTLLELKDGENDIDDFYFFDAWSDSVPKGRYDDPFYRIINYNFFAMNIDKVKKCQKLDEPDGVLNLFFTKNKQEYLQQKGHFISKYGDLEINKIESIFNCSLDNMFERINGTPLISLDNFISSVENNIVNELTFLDKKEGANTEITSNYVNRERKFFNTNINNMVLVKNN